MGRIEKTGLKRSGAKWYAEVYTSEGLIFSWFRTRREARAYVEFWEKKG